MLTVADVMRMKAQNDLDGLQRALKDADIAVRAEAVLSLGNVGDRRAVDPLISTLQNDSDPYVRSLAATALGQLGDPKARNPLINAIAGDAMEVSLAASKAQFQLEANIARGTGGAQSSKPAENQSAGKPQAQKPPVDRQTKIVGLVLGQGFEPDPKYFEELMAKGAIKSSGFQYVTAEVTLEEARDRDKVRDYYKAACINQGWQEGLQYAQDLKFSDVVVFGKPALIVEPQGVEPQVLEEPEAKPGGIIAGVGFMPTQTDLNAFTKQVKLQSGHEYVIKNFSRSEASSDISIATAYFMVARNQGWAKSSGSLSIQRRRINGKEILLIQRAPEEAGKPSGGKPRAKPQQAQPAGRSRAAIPAPATALPQKKSRGTVLGWLFGIAIILGFLIYTGSKIPKRSASVATVIPEARAEPTQADVAAVAPESPAEDEIVTAEEPQAPTSEELLAGQDYLALALAGELAGTHVTVSGSLPGDVVRIFDQSVAKFEDQTGIDVTYDAYSSINDFQQVLMVRVDTGDPPDIADIRLPQFLMALVDKGAVVDVHQFMDAKELQKVYNQDMLDLVTMESPDGPILAGIWHRVTPESVVWYPKKTFETAGYQVPGSWEALMALSQQIADEGGTAWCIGMESGGATGWVAVKWVENILLRITPSENYDRWISGELPFSSPEVTDAVETMSRVWFNADYVYGGTDGILRNYFYEAAIPMFEEPPKCWLHFQGPWITASFPDGLEPGVDYDFFPLPPIDETYGAPQIISGNIMTMFNDRPEVRALMAYFATGESAEAWARSGEGFSPHLDSDLSWYPNEIDRKLAKTLLEADTVRLTASDLMPPQVGQTAFWEGMVDYVEGADLAVALQTIDQAWLETQEE